MSSRSQLRTQQSVIIEQVRDLEDKLSKDLQPAVANKMEKINKAEHGE